MYSCVYVYLMMVLFYITNRPMWRRVACSKSTKPTSNSSTSNDPIASGCWLHGIHPISVKNNTRPSPLAQEGYACLTKERRILVTLFPHNLIETWLEFYSNLKKNKRRKYAFCFCTFIVSFPQVILSLFSTHTHEHINTHLYVHSCEIIFKRISITVTTTR